MKYTKTLDCHNYKQISNLLFQYILTSTYILRYRNFWNDVSHTHLLDKIPELAEYFSQLNLQPSKMAIVHVYKEKKFNDIHRDGADWNEELVRMQWGIINFEDTHTNIYKLKDEINYKPKLSTIDKAPYFYIHPDEVDKVDSFNLSNGPVIWKPSMPHRIMFTKTQPVYPRLSLTINFKDDINFLLE